MDDQGKTLGDPQMNDKVASARALTVRVDEKESLTGAMLDGRYLVKRKLGQGGFAVVYLASDEKMMSRPVVVKCLLDQTGNAWSLRKFKQEMEALARIDHPSIVEVYDTGQLPDGQPYLVMQYIEGSSLRSLIIPEGVGFWRAANIIRQIGRALTTAHDLGILHCDLKPENIMVQPLGDGEDQVKIIDFGIAKVKNSIVSATTAGDDRTVGTIAYMSPEQLSAQPVSAASDIYCFAVIVYEMLTGRRPTNPESAYQLLEMQRAGVRIKPVDLRPGLPELAQAIILKGLSFDPKARHQRARDFGDLLSSVLLGEDEQTLAQSSTDATPTEPDPELTMKAPETAHVLFIGIAGYSTMLIDEQSACLEKLQAIVGKTDDFDTAQRIEQLIRLSTGGGMALAFFGDPEAPVRCALEISHALRQCPEIKLRMGIHRGLVYRTSDINTNTNVPGGGINMAQRVMDFGDSGHILVSSQVAADLGEPARWSTQLHDIGEAEVKPGVRVRLFNLYTDEIGNPKRPAKLRPAPAKLRSRRSRRIVAIAAAVMVVALLGTIALFAFKRGSATGLVTPPVVAPPVREQSVVYWLTVQKMAKDKLSGEPFNSAGQEIYGNGWRFRFNLQPIQNGALYLLNEGAGADNKPEYNVLFPNPADNNGVAGLAANQKLDAGWFRFVDKTGVEKLWVIWSAESISELDEIFHDAVNHAGVITDARQIATVQTYLKRYESQPPEVIPYKAQKQTFVRGKGDVVVNLIELSHEAY
jgi:serine/threonine protein kinase